MPYKPRPLSIKAQEPVMINVFLSNQFNQITGQIKTNKMDPGDYKDLREQGMKKTKTITLILR